MACRQTHIALQRELAVSNRQPTKNLVHDVIEGTVSSVTMRGQRKGLRVRNVVAMKIANRSVGANLQIGWCSRQRHVQSHSSAPALIFAAQEFRELPQLRTIPFHAELHGGVAQAHGALP